MQIKYKNRIFSSIVGVTLNHWRVLKADYQNYALLYGCIYRNNTFAGRKFDYFFKYTGYMLTLLTVKNILFIEFLWIMTRTLYPSEKEWKRIMASVNEFSLDETKLKKINQKVCTAKAPKIPIPKPE